MLLPLGTVRTVDGRGPYRVTAPQSICAASLPTNAKLPLDEAHVTDKGAALGLPHPAKGWIVEMAPRDDGIYGRVDWNASGRALMEDRAYSGISPVVMHDKAGNVLRVLRASLTNTPNLEGMKSLQSEEIDMDWKAKLIELLGLDGSADDAAIEAALAAKMSGGQKELCSQDLLTHPTVVALQSQLGEVTNQLNGLLVNGRLAAATAFVDGAIAAGRVGVKPCRDEYIAMHSEDPAKTEALINKLPVINGTLHQSSGDAAMAVQRGALNRDDRTVIAIFGVNGEDYRAELAKGGQMQEAL